MLFGMPHGLRDVNPADRFQVPFDVLDQRHFAVLEPLPDLIPFLAGQGFQPESAQLRFVQDHVGQRPIPERRIGHVMAIAQRSLSKGRPRAARHQFPEFEHRFRIERKRFAPPHAVVAMPADAQPQAIFDVLGFGDHGRSDSAGGPTVNRRPTSDMYCNTVSTWCLLTGATRRDANRSSSRREK